MPQKAQGTQYTQGLSNPSTSAPSPAGRSAEIPRQTAQRSILLLCRPLLRESGSLQGDTQHEMWGGGEGQEDHCHLTLEVTSSFPSSLSAFLHVPAIPFRIISWKCSFFSWMNVFVIRKRKIMTKVLKQNLPFP